MGISPGAYSCPLTHLLFLKVVSFHLYLAAWASIVVHGFSKWWHAGSRACGLSSCGGQASLVATQELRVPGGTWDLNSRPGLELLHWKVDS